MLIMLQTLRALGKYRQTRTICLNVKMGRSVMEFLMVGHVATITEGGKNVLKTGQQCVPSLNVLLVELITVVTLIVAHMAERDNVVKSKHNCITHTKFSFSILLGT